MKKAKQKYRFAAVIGAIGMILVATGGCRLSDALVDGAYGGVSDVIANLVASTLLAGLP